MNLFNLTAQYQQLLMLLQSVEINEENQELYQNTLEAINDSFDQKMEGYAFVHKQLDYDDEMLTAEIKRLTEKRNSVRKNKERMKQAMFDSLVAVGKDRVKSPTFNIYIANNPPKLKINNLEEVPERFFIPQEPKVDKRSLLNALKDGNEIEGVEIEQTKGLRIR